MSTNLHTSFLRCPSPREDGTDSTRHYSSFAKSVKRRMELVHPKRSEGGFVSRETITSATEMGDKARPRQGNYERFACRARRSAGNFSNEFPRLSNLGSRYLDNCRPRWNRFPRRRGRRKRRVITGTRHRR